MKFTLTFDANNAAFDEQPATETARLLREAANAIEQHGDMCDMVRDINGNSIGWWEFTGEK